MSTHTENFLRSAASGIGRNSLAEVLLLLLAIAVVIGIFWYATRASARAENRRSRDINHRLIERFIRDHELTPSEVLTMTELQNMMPDADTTSYKLYSDRLTFEKYRRKLVEADPARAQKLLALEVKLDFDHKHEGKIINSTAEIPPGTTIHLQLPQGNLLSRMMSREAASLSLQIPASVKLSPPVQVHARFHRREGFYSFSSHVTFFETGLIKMNHSPLVFRRQMREFIRAALPLSLEVQEIPLTTLDISAGGARAALHPGDHHAFKAGKSYPFILHLDGSVVITGWANVVDVDADEIRVRFSKIRESDRDRIFRRVMRTHTQETGQNKQIPAKKDVV